MFLDLVEKLMRKHAYTASNSNFDTGIVLLSKKKAAGKGTYSSNTA